MNGSTQAVKKAAARDVTIIAWLPPIKKLAKIQKEKKANPKTAMDAATFPNSLRMIMSPKRYVATVVIKLINIKLGITALLKIENRDKTVIEMAMNLMPNAFK